MGCLSLSETNKFNLFTLCAIGNYTNSRLKHATIKNSFTRRINREMERKKDLVDNF